LLLTEMRVFLAKLYSFLGPPSFKEWIRKNLKLLGNASNDGFATALGFLPCLEGSGQVIPKEA